MFKLPQLSKLTKSFAIVVFIKTVNFMVFTFIGGMVEMPHDWSWAIIGFGLGFFTFMMSFALNVMCCYEDYRERRSYFVYHAISLTTGIFLEAMGLIYFLMGKGGTVLIGLGLSYILCIPMSLIFFWYNLHSELLGTVKDFEEKKSEILEKSEESA